MAATPTYTREFFECHSTGSANSADRILPIVFDRLHPASVADVGCGTGTWLARAQRLGVSDVRGFDGDYVDHSLLAISPDNFVSCDLQHPLPTRRRFDLVICMEVAEHLPARSADTLVAELSRIGDVILFSAAIPGQGGTHHVNEQWPGYWAERFKRHGYVFCDCIRPRVWDDPVVEWWYAQNAFVVLSESLTSAWSNYGAIGSPRALVHPTLWEGARAARLSFSTLLREMPSSLTRAVGHRVAAARDRVQPTP